MDLNQISLGNSVAAAGYVAAGAINTVNTEAAEDASAEENAQAVSANQEAAVYEASSRRGANALDTDTIKAMKDELEQRTQSLVQQMLGKQLDTLGKADDSFWQKFRKGAFDVDPETQAQAQKDIAEDGYWGVEQTSDRIVKYATALSGGDPDKLETLINAFEKGYEAATKSWGAELPDISKRTREAVLDKFDKLKQEYAKNSTSSTGTTKVVGG